MSLAANVTADYRKDVRRLGKSGVGILALAKCDRHRHDDKNRDRGTRSKRNNAEAAPKRHDTKQTHTHTQSEGKPGGRTRNRGKRSG